MNIFLYRKKYDIQSYRYIHKFLHYTERKNYTRYKLLYIRNDRIKFNIIYSKDKITRAEDSHIEYIIKYKKYDIICHLCLTTYKYERHSFFKSACKLNNIQLINVFKKYQDGIERGNICLSGNSILIKKEINNLSKYFNNTCIIQSGNIYLIKIALKGEFWNAAIYMDDFNYQLIKTLINIISNNVIKNKSKFLSTYQNMEITKY